MLFEKEKEMNAAKIDKSSRLQIVAKALRKSRKPLSTRDLIIKTGMCAINSIISELRQNGYVIECKRSGSAWYYWMPAK